MDMEDIFCKLEKFLKEPMNVDIKNILTNSGFDCKSALLGLNAESINEIEQYANKNRSVLVNTSYQNMKKFSFKPGHKYTIIDLPNQVKRMEESQDEKNMQSDMSDFSLVLKTYIDTAESNLGKNPKGFRYNDVNRYFSTYIYLFCGRSCYETLSANLPMPQANTIRKCLKMTTYFFLFSL